MAKWTVPYTYSFGEKPVSSQKFNDTNISLKAVVDNLDENNISTSSLVMVSDRNHTVSGVLTFTTAPVFSGCVIPDAGLSTNIPRLDGANTFAGNNTFSGTNTFNNAITGFRFPTLGVHPAQIAANDGLVYRYTDNKYYVYNHATTSYDQVNYTGAYTGGAIRSYNGQLDTDETNAIILIFKCDAGWGNANLFLKCSPFSTYHYTELPRHQHGASEDDGDLALASGTLLNITHTHITNIPSHTHGGTFSGVAHIHSELGHVHAAGSLATQSDGSHLHTDSGVTGVDGPADDTGSHSHTFSVTTNTVAGHTHNISGTVASSIVTTEAHSVIYNASVESTVIGDQTSGDPTWDNPPAVATALSGDTDSAGISGGTLNDTLKEYVQDTIQVWISQNPATSWGTIRDKNDGALANLVNINTVNGTGDMDISGWCATGTNYIKIKTPGPKKGGRMSYHLETY